MQSTTNKQQSSVMTIQTTADGRPLRTVRSFVLRTGRMSQTQQRAIDENWANFGLDFDGKTVNFAQIFGNKNPVVLEIGFGMGKSLVEMAENHPELNYLGIEVHTPGVGACLLDAKAKGLTNLRVMCHDAVEVLKQCIADHSLSGLQLFFPDPWHKAKHHKRRIVQPDFIAFVSQKLQQGGFIHMATDWQNYAEQMLETLQSAGNLRNLSPTGDYIERPAHRPLTKFEQRGQRLGHGIWDLYFVKA